MDRFEAWEQKLGLSLNPLSLMDLADAVRDRQDSVVLDGRNFALIYRVDHVFYTPVEGYAPCGWVKIEDLVRGP